MGRKRRFDEESLLDCAQERFWVQGYDQTSIDDISRCSGVGNGSIYAAYGNKLGLFLAVFNRYCNGRVELVSNVVDAHVGTFEAAVANYLDEIVAECTSYPDRRGCLMLNSLAELGTRFPDVVAVGSATVTGMERVLARRVEKSVEAGEITLAPDAIEPLGAHIVLVSQGLIQLSRFGVGVERLQSIAATSSRMSALLSAA
ncbi:TetR/AcrR family transcriptional regulator [Subtercola sp. YIM 133946]|uniref:TetR/AcrR family transcriptional regulator n=1 Tax=Subtercola sp. YIM 133946 TaxID=3118909 RepID=UPI002F92ACCC